MSNLPTAKDLKKLAAACRAAGITHFKSGDIEFTLGEAPQKPKKLKASNVSEVSPADSDEIETEGGLTQEELLQWSSAPGGMSLSKPTLPQIARTTSGNSKCRRTVMPNNRPRGKDKLNGSPMTTTRTAWAGQRRDRKSVV